MIHNVFGKLITGVILAVLYVGLAGCPTDDIPIPLNISELCDATQSQGEIRSDFDRDTVYTIDSKVSFQSLASCYTASNGRTFTVQETLAANYRLTKNLDFSQTPNFIPIGVERIAAGLGRIRVPLGGGDTFRGVFFYPRFSGTFDGRGLTISNVTIKAETFSPDVEQAADGVEQAAGLFGIVTGTVRNLNVSNIRVVGATFVGAIAGRNDGTIDTVSVRNGTIGGVGCGVKAGGLVGQNFGMVSSGVVTNINVVGTSCANDDIGGLVGLHLGSIVNSSATGQINTGSDTSVRICGLVPVRGGSACDAIGEVASGRTILGSSGSIDSFTNDNTDVTIEPNTAPPPPDE